MPLSVINVSRPRYSQGTFQGLAYCLTLLQRKQQKGIVLWLCVWNRAQRIVSLDQCSVHYYQYSSTSGMWYSGLNVSVHWKVPLTRFGHCKWTSTVQDHAVTIGSTRYYTDVHHDNSLKCKWEPVCPSWSHCPPKSNDNIIVVSYASHVLLAAIGTWGFL